MRCLREKVVDCIAQGWAHSTGRTPSRGRRTLRNTLVSPGVRVPGKPGGGGGSVVIGGGEDGCRRTAGGICPCPRGLECWMEKDMKPQGLQETVRLGEGSWARRTSGTVTCRPRGSTACVGSRCRRWARRAAETTSRAAGLRGERRGLEGAGFAPGRAGGGGSPARDQLEGTPRERAAMARPPSSHSAGGRGHIRAECAEQPCSSL